MMRILICFIVAVVMLLSPLVPLEAAAPHKHCWWHHHHHYCHTWGPRNGSLRECRLYPRLAHCL